MTQTEGWDLDNGGQEVQNNMNMYITLLWALRQIYKWHNIYGKGMNWIPEVIKWGFYHWTATEWCVSMIIINILYVMKQYIWSVSSLDVHMESKTTLNSLYI